MISPSDSLADGMTLVSNDGSFELGFFTPGSSKNRYLGIWYKNIPMQTVVWVANRINPINDSTGSLKIETTGRVVLQGQNRTIVWSINSSTEGARNPILKLLDSGNLVVKDGNSENYLWQSFDYPTDTMLPGMKIGWDLRIGVSRRLAAWKNPDDPSPGDLTYGVELEGNPGNPELVIRKGSVKYVRSGLWNGEGFTGSQVPRNNPVFTYDFVWNEEEVYYTFFLKHKAVMSRVFLNQTEGVMDRYTWNPETQTWNLFFTIPNDYCDRSYGLCGANADCDSSKFPVCQCLKAFKPKSPESWNSADWSQGCIHNKPLNCQSGDKFMRIKSVKTPDATHSWVNRSMDLEECRTRCLKNCSCMAYTGLSIIGRGSGCAMWFGDLMDIKQYESVGQDLYIRVSASESEGLKHKHNMKIGLIIATPLAVLLGLLLVIYYYIMRSRGKLIDKGENEDLELEIFELGTISRATDGFSSNNKLGQGGFGPVYKAWKLWKEGRPLELADDFLADSDNLSESDQVLRCIHISLLCLQQHPDGRPSMSSVVVMLGSEIEFPLPKEPGSSNIVMAQGAEVEAYLPWAASYPALGPSRTPLT
ncbi:S-locus glycoprotein [Corchorus olitorius]|uniref:S-locus glycoprotein n=1 Tax=Corchorus olitorius TaxID=93759 RepID=A0A1R3KBX8_9ROSI|nr:S-locus glycoprotein [Corchorus olitorius]